MVSGCPGGAATWRALDGRLQLPARAGLGLGPGFHLPKDELGTVRQIRAAYLQKWLADRKPHELAAARGPRGIPARWGILPLTPSTRSSTCSAAQRHGSVREVTNLRRRAAWVPAGLEPVTVDNAVWARCPEPAEPSRR